ncbi:MAG: DNA polymerase III subunit beta [bacterium]|nr:DNA polymerase III subunit beta [bacterium]
MKIECIRERLQNALLYTERSTSKNQNLPVLSCVLLTAKDNSLNIRATNLDIGVEIDIPVKVIEEGSIAVPGSILYSYIAGISTEKNVLLEEKEGNLNIKSSKSSTLIKTLPSEEFPSLPYIEGGNSFSINSKNLANGLKSVWYSASGSSMKPELSSIYIYNDGGEAVFVATDSFRLAEKRVRVNDYNEGGSILIPFKNIPEIIKIFESMDGDVNVLFDKNQISFKNNSVYVVSRLVNGIYPDYKQIIPKTFLSEAIVLKQDLVSSLKISNIFIDKFNMVNISITTKDKKLNIATKNVDIGENNSQISGSFSGDDVSNNFNYKYITDCFQSISADSVSLGFGGIQKPLVLHGVGDKSFTYLIMPMNR